MDDRRDYTALEIMTYAIDYGLGWKNKDKLISKETIDNKLEVNEQDTYNDTIESLKELCQEYGIGFEQCKNGDVKFTYELSEDRIYEIYKKIKNRFSKYFIIDTSMLCYF